MDLEILRFESPDGATRVQVHRAYEAQGAGHSTIYRLDQWGMIKDGTTTCVSDVASLDYENSHHNWRDTARATHDGIRYELAMSFEPGIDATWTVSLVAYDAADTELFTVPSMITTGAPTLCWHCPGFVPVLVSELMAVNQTGITDEQGEREGWIELFNPSAEAVSLSGWSLSNDLHDRRAWSFPDVTIGRHEALLLIADGETEEGELHLPFLLSAGGGALILTAEDGRTNGGLTYGPQTPDVSLGYTYTNSDYRPMDTPTPGAQNPD